MGGDGAGFLACLFGGTDMGEPAPTNPLWGVGIFRQQINIPSLDIYKLAVQAR